MCRVAVEPFQRLEARTTHAAMRTQEPLSKFEAKTIMCGACRYVFSEVILRVRKPEPCRFLVEVARPHQHHQIFCDFVVDLCAFVKQQTKPSNIIDHIV